MPRQSVMLRGMTEACYWIMPKPVDLGVMRPENWTNDWWVLFNWYSVQTTELNRLDLSH
jgi:hypothetical protein